jgi:hypothetical protein
MDMSPAYLTCAAAALAEGGFSHDAVPVDLGLVDGLPCQGTQHRLRSGQSQLVLEHIAHPSAGDMYYLEVTNHSGLCLPSFRLDSWKVWPNRIEFKFYETEDGRSGLSMTLALPAV